jgi:hypothetical protein
MAIDSLSHLKGIIVEGNSAIEVLNPDVIIFNAGEPEKSKKNADRVLMMADIVVFEHEPPANAPGKSRKFHSADWEEIIRYVTEAVVERRG